MTKKERPIDCPDWLFDMAKKYGVRLMNGTHKCTNVNTEQSISLTPTQHVAYGTMVAAEYHNNFAFNSMRGDIRQCLGIVGYYDRIAGESNFTFACISDKKAKDEVYMNQAAEDRYKCYLFLIDQPNGADIYGILID